MPPSPAPSRRVVVRSVGLLVAATGLTACTRRSRTTKQTEPPSPDGPAKDPGKPLVIGSVGTSIGLESQFEKQISLAIGEARIDVDNAGGVFGRGLELVDRHVVTDPADDLAGYLEELTSRGASAVIMSCDDDVLARAAPAFAAAGIVVVSVTSTSTGVRAEEVATLGLLFRLSLTDRGLATMIGGKVLAAAGEGLEPRSLAYLSRDATQGHSLESALRDVIEPAYGTVPHVQYFAPDAPALDIPAVLAARPASIVVNGGQGESESILAALHTANLGPDGRPVLDIPMYLTYYNSAAYGDRLPVEALAHASGLRAGAVPSPAHVDMMLGADPSLGLAGYDFSEEAYDAVVVLALAALSGATVEGTQIAQYIPGILGDGDEVDSYEAGLTSLRDSADIQYVGRSGKIVLKDGDPISAQLTTVSYSDSNQVENAQSTGVDLPV